MAFNPSQKGTQLNNPTERANQLNDPQFTENQGYFSYDLTHQEFVTPRYGEIIPTLNIHTVPGDRIVNRDNVKTILNQINGNFLNTVNQYIDSFFVPMRCYFPTNYEKLIPNPTKGVDLPNMALPQFPIATFVNEFLDSQYITINGKTIQSLMSFEEEGGVLYSCVLGRYLLLSTILSRGQLLDYLGCAFDDDKFLYKSAFQESIDNLQRAIYEYVMPYISDSIYKGIIAVEPDLTADTYPSISDFLQSSSIYEVTDLSTYRSALADIFESGKVLYFPGIDQEDALPEDLKNIMLDFRTKVISIFSEYFTPSAFVNAVNTSSNPFDVGFINIEKCIAYQMCVAQYYTRDSIDNIYNSDLFLQLLRAVMYPSIDGFSSEPTFLYNGVATEYDYISCGGAFYSLIDSFRAGVANRQWVFSTLMFLMRRSLRYGDYFATSRPNMLAVGQLSIDVQNGKVSPIDVTKNLLMQRYLNAANYIGSGFLPYFASIYGVTPSDSGSFPRFISHRKIELANDITTNTANDQGKQTTNLVGYSDENGFDVFIDDLGVMLSLTSYDVLPVYKSGIDNTFHFADRFDYFNPMLQNIGDQPIRLSELVGDPSLRSQPFGYTMRDAQYKYKLSKAHGAFVNSLPGFLLSFPISAFDTDHISPDFIRDKPLYLDRVVPQMTGISPGEYYHFVVSVVNQLQCARKIQATPPVLF